MPNGVNGLDLARSARRLRPGLKTMLVSGYTQQHVLNGEGDDFAFLEKPFRQADLAAKVAAILK